MPHPNHDDNGDDVMSKKCCKCKEVQPLSYFYKCNKSKDGKAYRCKACTKTAAKVWREQNIDQAKENCRRWHNENADHLKRRRKEYYQKNFKQITEANEQWKSRNPELVGSIKQRYRKKHRAKCLAAADLWRQSNKDRHLSNQRKWREKNREAQAIRYLLRGFLRRSKMGKQGLTNKVLGYSAEHLRQRIECQFSPGMDWQNYGEWHLDHKIPVSKFIARGEVRPEIVNALSNLQPLWASDNLSKGNRFSG